MNDAGQTCSVCQVFLAPSKTSFRDFWGHAFCEDCFRRRKDLPLHGGLLASGYILLMVAAASVIVGCLTLDRGGAEFLIASLAFMFAGSIVLALRLIIVHLVSIDRKLK